MKEIKEYCPWQKRIFEVMTNHGYTFDRLNGTGTHPLYYVFSKRKQIGENRYKVYIMNIIVNNHSDGDKYKRFTAEYKLELKEYSLNERGYINNYWGKTPWATAESLFWKDSTDTENFIKNLKYHYPY